MWFCLIFVLVLLLHDVEGKYQLFRGRFNHAQAQRKCATMGWKLSEGHPNSLRHIPKRAWLNGVAVRSESLPKGISLYYKYGDKCCKISVVDEECSEAICECYAPALCYNPEKSKNEIPDSPTIPHDKSS